MLVALIDWETENYKGVCVWVCENDLLVALGYLAYFLALYNNPLG